MTPNTKVPMDKIAKGGRQRQFSNEQRKDRNRQAQAAFRERRSKHTKALEDTITDLRTMVQILQQNSLQDKERADKAEKRYQLVEYQYQQLKATIDSILPQLSPSSCESPLTRPSSALSAVPPVHQVYSQQPWLMDDWDKTLSGSTSIHSLDEPLIDDTPLLDQPFPLSQDDHYLDYIQDHWTKPY